MAGGWDNVFIERLRRSLKQKCVCLNAFETGSGPRTGLGRWIDPLRRAPPLTGLIATLAPLWCRKQGGYTSGSERCRSGRCALDGALSRRVAVAAMLLALNIVGQFTALGMNSDWLSAIAAVANVATAFAVVVLTRPGGRLIDALAVPVLIAILGLAWATAPDVAFLAWGSPDGLAGHRTPDLTLTYMARFGGQLAILVCAATLGARRGTLRAFVDTVLLLGAANVLLGFVLWRIDPFQVWGQSKTIHIDRFTGTLQNANAAGAFFGMLATIAIGRLLQRVDQGAHLSSSRPFLGLAVTTLEALALLGGCMATGSRVALGLTLIAVLVLLLRQVAGSRQPKQARLLLLGGIAITIAAAVPLLAPQTLARVATLGGDSVSRMAMWHYYVDLARQAPLWGYGLGSFSDASLAGLRTPEQALQVWNVNAAHNQALQLLLAGGWPFLTLILISAILFARPVARSFGGIAATPLPLAVVAGAAVALGCSMVDIAMTFPAILSAFLACTGLIWGRVVGPLTRPRRRAAAEGPVEPSMP